MDSQAQPCDKKIAAGTDKTAHSSSATDIEAEIVSWIIANDGCEIGSTEGVECHGLTGLFKGTACPLYMTGLCQEGLYITGLNAVRTGRLWMKVFHGDRVETPDEQKCLSGSDVERIAQLEKENAELQNQSERLMEGLFIQVERRRVTEDRIERLQDKFDTSQKEADVAEIGFLNVIKQMGKVIAQLSGNE